MTQEELSLACHISRAFLAQIETGKKTGSVKTLKKIATVLKIDLDFLTE